MRPLALLAIPLLLGALLSFFKVPLLSTFMGVKLDHYSMQYLQQSPEDFLTKNQETILEDRKLLEDVSFFSLGSSGQGDASHVLNPLIFTNADTPFTLETKLQQQLELKEDWTQLKWEELNVAFKTDWISSLQGFDHWNFDLARTQEKTDLETPWRLSTRHLSPLLNWIKIHYLHGRENKDVIRVLQDGRHLARLLSTTDTIEGWRFALQILRLENQFLDSLSEEDTKGLSWLPVPTKMLNGAHRFFSHAEKYLDERLTNESFLVFFNHPDGKCALVQAALQRHLAIKHHPQKHLFAEGLQRIHQSIELSQRGCRSGLLRTLWKAEQSTFPALAYLPQDSGWFVNFLKRRLKGENLKNYPNLVLALYYQSWSQKKKETYREQAPL